MLRAGIIGCGGIAERRHAPVLDAAPGVDLVALADVSRERLAQLGERHRVPPEDRFTDYQEMLAQAALDLVHVCTPHDQHEAQAVAALEAGSHVLIEKPIATDLGAADRMMAAAERTGRKLTVSHNQLFSASHEASKACVVAGDLGRVFLVRSEGFGGAHVAGLGANRDWRTQAGAGGGGPLIDNGYHQVYRAVDYTGSPIARAYARIGRHVHGIEVEDTALVLFEHADGSTTSLQVGWAAPGGSVRVDEVFGTEGQLRLGGEAPVRLYRHETDRWETVPVRAEGRDELGFPQLVSAFVAAIAADGPVPVRAADSRHALAAVLAAYESGRRGRPVDVA